MMLFLQEQDSLELLRVKLSVANIATYLNITQPGTYRAEVDRALRRLWVRWDEINNKEAIMSEIDPLYDHNEECNVHFTIFREGYGCPECRLMPSSAPTRIRRPIDQAIITRKETL